MSTVVVVSGSGAYADAWHPFPDTSSRIADLIAELGHDVSVRDDVEAVLAAPDPCRLLIVNIGNPAVERPAEAVRAIGAGLERHLATGGSLLGIHSAATSLTTLATWPGILGGHWERGHTMHPSQGQARVLLSESDHLITAGLDDFTVFDERYSYLRTGSDITVIAEHAHDGKRHPLVWIRESASARIAYDGLGHDTSSYDSQGHRALLSRLVRWLLHEL